jgi:hypothetical protein
MGETPCGCSATLRVEPLAFSGEGSWKWCSLHAAAPDLRRLLVVAYDALFFERGMTPQERDDMRRILEATTQV